MLLCSLAGHIMETLVYVCSLLIHCLLCFKEHHISLSFALEIEQNVKFATWFPHQILFTYYSCHTIILQIITIASYYNSGFLLSLSLHTNFFNDVRVSETFKKKKICILALADCSKQGAIQHNDVLM